MMMKKTIGIFLIIFFLLPISFALAEESDDDTEQDHAALNANPAGTHDRKAPKVILPDADIRKNLGRGFAETKTVHPRNVTVGVNRGVVILVGTVGSVSERKLADAVARTSPGVRAVRNRLRIAPPVDKPWPMGDRRRLENVMMDQELREAAREKLASLSLVRQADMSLEIYSGVAVIAGPIPSEAVKKKAHDLLLYIPHMRAVIDHTWVEEEPKKEEPTPTPAPPASEEPEAVEPPEAEE